MTAEKEFVPPQESLELKELGFDEPCFKMSEHKKLCDEQSKPQGCQLHNLHCGYPDCTIDKSITPIPLPTFSQAFRFFREKYGLRIRNYGSMNYSGGLSEYFEIFKYGYGTSDKSLSIEVGALTYEEAELACLRKLIQIVKEKTRISTN